MSMPPQRSSSGSPLEPAAQGRTAPGFIWPTPPYASYPAAVPQSEPEPCEIEGLNGKAMRARLTLFDPGQELLQVQLPPARTTLPLRMNQFRHLTLLTPLRPVMLGGADRGDWLDFHPAISYQVELNDGSQLSGRTIGHVETPEGLFLFPPTDEQGTVQRLFVAKGMVRRVGFGPSLGEVLVAHQTANPAQIATALAEQQELRAQRLGDVLLNLNVVSREQLEAALATQARMPMMRIGEALMGLGLLSQGQLDQALAEQSTNRTVPLGELLVRSGKIQRTELRTALARKMGYPIVRVEDYPIDLAALKQVPYQTARRLCALPLQALPGRLVVAIEDPSRGDVLEELAFTAQGKVVAVLPATDDLAGQIVTIYQRNGLADSLTLSPIDAAGLSFDEDGTDRLVADLELSRQADASQDESAVEQADSTLVRLINTMIVEARNQGVSDIHIETHPGSEKLRIRFRRDGMLRPYLELPHTYRSAMIARIKVMCDLDISERRRPQDGKINFGRFVPSCPLELRVATIPTANGLEDAVMRLLASAKPIPLDKLGMSPRNLKALMEAVERPYGMVLCVGPTGSGKTTTLHSALSYINIPERKIWTAEDPVEITQPGLRQVQVNPKIDWTFAKALRAFLRADPDVIMVGEIRDAETARIAVESSLTGHLVLSTLHTNSAAETVTRLVDMGMDPFNFADALLAVLAQRLVRRLCPSCKVAEPASPEWVEELLDDYLHVLGERATATTRDSLRSEWLQRFGSQGRLMKHHSPGCKACEQTGVRGRVGIHELLTISRELRHLIQTGARADDILQQSLSEGLRTLRQDGIEKVLAGMTSLEDVRATSNL